MCDSIFWIFNKPTACMCVCATILWAFALFIIIRAIGLQNNNILLLFSFGFLIAQQSVVWSGGLCVVHASMYYMHVLDSVLRVCAIVPTVVWTRVNVSDWLTDWASECVWVWATKFVRVIRLGNSFLFYYFFLCVFQCLRDNWKRWNLAYIADLRTRVIEK